MTLMTIAARGFAAMDPQRQRELARKGGRMAHEKGAAHRFTTEEASAAGRKGGQRVAQNREYMAMIGRRGGQKSGARRQQQVGAVNLPGPTAERDPLAVTPAAVAAHPGQVAE